MTVWHLELLGLCTCLVSLKTQKGNAVFQKMDSPPSPDKKMWGDTYLVGPKRNIVYSAVIYRLRTTLFLKSQAE